MIQLAFGGCRYCGEQILGRRRQATRCSKVECKRAAWREWIRRTRERRVAIGLGIDDPLDPNASVRASVHQCAFCAADLMQHPSRAVICRAAGCKRRFGSERGRRFHETHRAYRRELLCAEYGLTVEQLDRLVLESEGRCYTCDSTAPLAIDHCHATGVVRGLLCAKCNTALGLAKEREDVLRRLATYIGEAPNG